jgi:hypothetical protein
MSKLRLGDLVNLLKVPSNIHNELEAPGRLHEESDRQA